MLAEAVLLLALVVTSLQGKEAVVQAAFATSPPVIDGVLAPGEWSGAAPLSDFLQLVPRRGEPAGQVTHAYILFDSTHLYVGVYAFDDQPDTITARLNNRDDPLVQDDSVTVYLDTFHDRRTCYFFSTNPLSTQTDGRITDNGRVEDTVWDAQWDVAAQRLEDGWSAEFAIPLRVLQFRPGVDRTWGFNIGRSHRRSLEDSFWAGPLQAASRVSQYGELRGLSLEGGAKRWDLIPYVQGSIAQANSQGQGGSTRGNAGVDLRYTFRPETIANVTINPDFAIIEADQEFVNLTRFEVQLQERRPFFQETNDRFRQRIQSFYSRRIGDIDAGGKVISRDGKWESTVLSVRSARIESPNEEQGFVRGNYTVGRVERELSAGSQVALQVANRSLGGENRGSAGLDTSLRFNRVMTFSGQLLQATGPVSGGKLAYFVRPAWDTSTFHFHYRYTHLGDAFADNVNAIGFIRDDDRREMDSDLRKQFFFQKSPVQRVSLESKNNIFWSQKGVLRGYHNILAGALDFRNRWTVGSEFTNEFRQFERGFHNDTVKISTGYNTREFQSWEVFYETGKNFGSDLKAVGAGLKRKITRKLATEYQLSRVWLDPDPGNSTLR